LASYAGCDKNFAVSTKYIRLALDSRSISLCTAQATLYTQIFSHGNKTPVRVLFYTLGPNGMSQSDAELSLASLVTDHAADLYRYGYRLCGSTVDAEDLVQQTFLLAQQHLDQLRDPTASRAWLFSLLRSAYGRLVRKTRPSCGTDCDCQFDDLPEADINSLDGPFDVEALQLALNKLPDDQRLVVVGFYFEECSYQELAQRLQIPLGTVMSRLARAKAQLRMLLAEKNPAVRESTQFADEYAARGLSEPTLFWS
jgi:RNA polymerase sigma-70 factor (ECF subfamily)